MMRIVSACLISVILLFVAITSADAEEAYVRPLITVPMTQTPPRIDGKIGREEWENAVVTTGFFRPDGKLATNQTIVYVMYDAENLYLGFESSFSGVLKTEVSEQDGPISQDDSLEIYLLPDSKPSNQYYQFLGNSIGTVYDGKGKDKSWQGEWEFKNNVEMDQWLTAGVWTAEVRTSFKSLGVDTPGDNEKWLVNFCRNWQMKTTLWTSWSHPAGYHSPERFATLVFKRDVPAIKMKSLGDFLYGDIKIGASAHNSSPASRSITTEISVILKENGKQILKRSIDTTVPPSKSVPLPIEGSVALASKEAELGLSITVKDSVTKETIYQTEHRWICYPSFWISLTPAYGKGYVAVDTDVRRVANLPKRFTGFLEVLNTNTREELHFDDKVAHTSVDISGFEPGEYRLRVQLTDGKKQTIAGKTASFTVPEKPEWLKRKVGTLDGNVPYPWTPVAVKGNNVLVWGREYEFEDVPFPSRIVTKGENILKGPITLKAVVDGHPIKWRREEFVFVEQTDVRATLKMRLTSPKVTLEGAVEVGFDGMIRSNFTLIPDKSSSKIDSLIIEIPFNRQNIKYARAVDMRNFLRSPMYLAGINDIEAQNEEEPGVHKVSKISFYSPAGWKYEDKFITFLWMGDDERGIFWVFESDENMHIKKKYTEIKNEGDKTYLRVFLIDNPVSFVKPVAYTVGLSASPTKPSIDHSKLRRLVFAAGSPENMEKYDLEYMYATILSQDIVLKGYLSAKPESLKTQVKRWHDRGIKVLFWIDYGFTAMETPAFELYGKEWELTPVYRQPNGTSDGSTGTLVCVKSSWADYFLYQVERLIDESDIDGVYFDMSGPSGCANQHHGCGYVKDGKVERKVNFFAERDFHIRLYNLFKSRKKDAIIFQHGTSYDPATRTFPDMTITGEGYTTEKDYSSLTLGRFRTEFMTNQYGLLPLFYPVLDLPWYSSEGSRVPMAEIFSFSLIHNIFPNVVYAGLNHGTLALDIYKAMDEFGTDDAEWVPYWRNDLISSVQKDIKISLYKKTSKMLLVLSNLGVNDIDVDLKVNPKILPKRARDVLGKEEFEVVDSTLKLNVPSKRMRLISLDL